MKIQKEKNTENCYDFRFREDNKELKIQFAGNLDLYLSMSNGDFIPEKEETNMYFYITKENYQLYSAFDELYDDIISRRPFGKDTKYNYDLSFSDEERYKMLVDNNKNITWISDEGPIATEDRITISKYDEDTYRLHFMRPDKKSPNEYKSSTNIIVRISNSGSRYNPFNCAFMLMYNKIQSIDPKYHQMHFEEVEYIKKLEKKRSSK